jgi:hypothetical protein
MLNLNMGKCVFKGSGVLILFGSSDEEFFPKAIPCPPKTKLKKLKFGIGQKVYTKGRREFIVIGVDAVGTSILYTVAAGTNQFKIPEHNLYFFSELPEVAIDCLDKIIEKALFNLDKISKLPAVPEPVGTQKFIPLPLNNKALKAVENALCAKASLPLCQDDIKVADPKVIEAMLKLQKATENAIKKLDARGDRCD